MKAIEKRTFRYKKPHLSFFCPLCSTSRSIVTNPKVSRNHHLQVTVLTIFSTLLFFPICGFKSLFLYFFYWAVFEFTRRLIFKKDIPCPHCGFDASWYKRDVKVARTKVKEFWSHQSPKKAETTVDSASQ